MESVKLGLIGMGYIGKVHLRNCIKLRSAKLEAVADISDKALNSARNMGIKKTFEDYQQLLKEPDIDAVIISLPTHLHLHCATDAAQAGKHIFLEKPLARDVTEGNAILLETRKNGIKLMVGYPYRFSSSFRSLKEKIADGMLGEVQIARGTNIGSGPFFHRAEGDIPRPVPSWWFEDKLIGGGSLMDQGIHLLNLFRWYFGEIKEIKSYLGYRFNMNSEDHATCIAKFQSGPTCVINVGWFSNEAKIQVELFGTVKHVSAEQRAPSKIITAIQLLAGMTPKFYVSYLAELQHFVDSVKNDLEPSPSAADAIKDLESISLAYKNAVRI